MFLEIFFRFLSDFGDNFREGSEKILELPGRNYEENKKLVVKNFRRNCKILRHNS